MASILHELPDASAPLLAQANLARIRAQWSEAVEICVRVLRSDPGNADAHSLLGDIYRDQGALDDAVQWYRMAADLRPNGPDGEKLARLEAERERRAAQASALAPSAELSALEGGSSGTTQLAGASPRRWLTALTIISASFLAATLLVLVALRLNPAERANALPRQMPLSSHVSMPTADTAEKLPPANPYRATVLPAGEQSQPAPKVHQTGDGLEPDRTSSSRSGALPTFAPQTSAHAAQSPTQGPGTVRELPPAPVKTITPLDPRETAPAAEQTAGSLPSSSIGTSARHPSDSAAERLPNGLPGTAKPAPETGAGENSQNAGGTAPER